MQKKSTKSHVNQPKTKMEKELWKANILANLDIFWHLLTHSDKKNVHYKQNRHYDYHDHDHDHQVELGVSCQLDKQGGEPDDRGLMILPLTVSDQWSRIGSYHQLWNNLEWSIRSRICSHRQSDCRCQPRSYHQLSRWPTPSRRRVRCSISPLASFWKPRWN